MSGSSAISAEVQVQGGGSASFNSGSFKGPAPRPVASRGANGTLMWWHTQRLLLNPTLDKVVVQ
eukprot:7977957-Pyramimonas_sp.AAC.1